jgi:hypothetical protein
LSEAAPRGWGGQGLLSNLVQCLFNDGACKIPVSGGEQVVYYRPGSRNRALELCVQDGAENPNHRYVKGASRPPASAVIHDDEGPWMSQRPCEHRLLPRVDPESANVLWHRAWVNYLKPCQRPNRFYGRIVQSTSEHLALDSAWNNHAF